MTAQEPVSRTEKLEEEASLAGVVAAEALTAFELGVAVLIGLLVVPPLGILVFTIGLPLLVLALVVALVAAVLSTPYLLIHYIRSHHRSHPSLFAHRLRQAGRALFDLLPHRIVADAHKLHGGQ